MEYQKAIDTIIQFSGETPVNAPNEHPLQGNIETFLNNTIAREQLLGWWFNIDKDITFQADETGKVRIPSQIQSIVFETRGYVNRGGYVYDGGNNTYLIKQSVVAIQTTRILDWSDMPELMQQWCMFQAGKYYIVTTIGDQGITKELKEEAAKTLFMLKAQDLKCSNINVFNTPAIARMRNGRRPYGGR